MEIIKDKVEKIDSAIDRLNKLKYLLSTEHNLGSNNMKASIRKDIRFILDKSELTFEKRYHKVLYDIYKHFGLYKYISRKQMKIYLLKGYGIEEKTSEGLIRRMDNVGCLNDPYYNEWNIQRNYERYGMKLPKIYSTLCKRKIKDDKTHQFLINEFTIFHLIQRIGLDPRDEDLTFFAKLALKQQG